MTGPVVGLAVHLARANRLLRDQLAAAEAEVDRLRSELVVQQARVRRWRLVVEAITPFLNDQARTAVDFQCMSDDLADIDEYHRPETENR